MSDCNGYWCGKKRDQKTINALAKAKYKQVLQIDPNGKIIKLWNSIKHAAINFFDDYQIINGSSKSVLYNIVRRNNPANKLYDGYYWFLADDVEYHKNMTHIDLNKIFADYQNKQKLINQKKTNRLLQYKKKGLTKKTYPYLITNLKTKKSFVLYGNEKVAKKIGCHKSHVSRIARGDMKQKHNYIIQHYHPNRKQKYENK